MAEFLDLHRELYNAALQERRDAWRVCRKSVSIYDQEKALSEIRQLRPDIVPLTVSAMRGTLRQLDFAFQSFFRRCKEGTKEKGFPRFKSKTRFNSFTYVDGSGWKLLAGRLRLTNIGTMQARGQARTLGTPKTLTVMNRNGKWYASVTVECEPQRQCSGVRPVGLDLGLKNLATLSNGEVILNPRHLSRLLSRLRSEQRSLSRKKRGSHRYEKQRQLIKRLQEHVANARKDYLHKVTSRLISEHNGIAVERMLVAGMNANGGARKRGLNRSIADAAWGLMYQMLEYKAGEAGIRYIEVDPRRHAPTQTCSRCGERAKKELSERTHHCSACGLTIDRDVNAAINVLNIAFGPGTGPCVEG
jgi:putative transposase